MERGNNERRRTGKEKQINKPKEEMKTHSKGNRIIQK